MVRTKRSADCPKTFSTTPSLPIGPLPAGLHGERYQTFWHGSERECLAAIWREYVENERQPWTVRHYYYILKNAGLLKTATDLYPIARATPTVGERIGGGRAGEPVLGSGELGRGGGYSGRAQPVLPQR
ncbi:MAG TPA: hypothetical protein VK457_23905, partial [Chloroflexota bacterium]|nr:hypothetical protein [Chloroflexota bacterium]